MAVNDLSPRPMALTLRVLAHLLSYPDEDVRAHLSEMREALHGEAVLDGRRLDEIDALIRKLECEDPLTCEAEYVELFDRGRGTALHLFEHVHGDSRDRGPAMIDLAQTYEQAGLYLRPGELPDHLTVVLQFASTQPPKQAVEFLGELAHIVRSVFSALLKRRSPYACLMAAVLELAGESAQAVVVVDDDALDESWQEPVVFGGCSQQGQAKSGQSQSIHIVRTTRAAAIPRAGSASSGAL